MKIKQEDPVYRPITITFETQQETKVFLFAMRLVKSSYLPLENRETFRNIMNSLGDIEETL